MVKLSRCYWTPFFGLTLDMFASTLIRWISQQCTPPRKPRRVAIVSALRVLAILSISRESMTGSTLALLHGCSRSLRYGLLGVLRWTFRRLATHWQWSG